MLDSIQEILDRCRAEDVPFWRVVRASDMEQRQVTAFTAPMTFRLMQGTSTNPATGSQTRPMRFFRAMAQALAIS